MANERFKITFAKNLNHYLKINSKNQTDLVNDLGFNKATVSTWCNGKKIPRMDKVDLLCSYFRINRSDLINNAEDIEKGENSGENLRQIKAKELVDNFTEDELDIILEMIRAVKRKEI